MNLAVIDKVSVVATSKTLATLGITVEPQLRRLVLIPAGTVNWARGTASGSTPTVPLTGLDFPCDAANAAKLQFYAATVDLTVLQFC